MWYQYFLQVFYKVCFDLFKMHQPLVIHITLPMPWLICITNAFSQTSGINSLITHLFYGVLPKYKAQEFFMHGSDFRWENSLSKMVGLCV